MHAENVMCARQLKDYVRRHAQSWYSYLDTMGLRDEINNQDLLLVTGRSGTSEWAVAAFTQRKSECGIEFRTPTGLGSVGAGVLLSGSWANANSVEHRAGPVSVNPSNSPMASQLDASSPHLPFPLPTTHERGSDQTVFVRGLYVRLRGFAPIKMKAAAEPTNDDYDRQIRRNESSFDASDDSPDSTHVMGSDQGDTYSSSVSKQSPASTQASIGIHSDSDSLESVEAVGFFLIFFHAIGSSSDRW